MEEEFEIDINEAEPAFLKGQSSRSGVEVCGMLTNVLNYHRSLLGLDVSGSHLSKCGST